jgi:hypothetical protein
VGLLADFQYPRREVTYDRSADTVGHEGSSQSRLIVYRPPGGIGLYQTFYTVPNGKVFLLRHVSSEPGSNVIRVNGLDTFSGGETQDFDPAVKFEAGTTFEGWANVAGKIVRLIGLEEDLSVQAARNYL